MQIKDKENVSANNNRAIVAVSMVQKPPQRPTTMLKNVLKKSVSVPLAPAQKKTLPAPMEMKKEVKSDNNMTISKKVQPSGQRQFDYAEAQKKRKDLLIQKLKEQEDKELKFNFHANPAPKFKKVASMRKPSLDERKLVKQTSLPHISKRYTKESVPSCGDPERLKYNNEKKKLLAAKYQEPVVPFKAKPAAVLKKDPFQPVRNIAKLVDSKPFKLQLTERLLLRSEFDKKLHETINIRKNQEDIRQRQQALEDRKLIRQKTEFRARANPFRNNQ